MSLVDPSYRYRGRRATGKIVSGRMTAASEGAVLLRLRALDLTPVSIDRAERRAGLSMELSLASVRKTVTLSDLAVMSRQLATMVAAGLTLLRALTILGAQTESRLLASTLADVRGKVEGGLAFSESLGAYPLVFPRLMVQLARAGEVGGFLDRSLESVADTFEADLKLRRKIRTALTYPLLVLAMAVLAVIAMLIFIVPVFQKMFAGLNATLPLPTRVLVTLSHSAAYIVPIVVILAAIAWAWWGRNRHTEKIRRVIDPVLLKVPVFGPLLAKVAIARFTRNFGMMAGSGVPVLHSLAIVGETSGNWVIENALRNVQEAVRAGRTITGPLGEQAIFPTMVVQMLAVGEDSGTLQLMLTKIADFYDAEIEAVTAQLSSLIEPLMISVIGIVVGGMIIALYLPMFTIYDAIR